ncbi:MAG: DUF63 family protein [Halanaeroarchaeum sp.]
MTFPETRIERIWTAGVLVVLGGLVGGSLLFTDLVYGSFVWHYFWGPVFADAHNAACAVWNGGSPVLHATAGACTGASGPVAYPGYTLVSEVGYAVILITALMGLVFLLRRLEVGERVEFIYPLVPFMLFGGALRVVEDAMDSVPQGVDPAIQYPLNTLFISPLIYFTVFGLTLGALVVAIVLERRGSTGTYEWPLAGIGSGLLLASLAYLGYLAATRRYVEFNPAFTVLTLLFATAIAVGLWRLLTRYYPAISSGTPRLGALVLWAHSIDGVSNVLGLDWGRELGLEYDMIPKHPVNRLIVDVTQSTLPESLAAVIGTAWPFLLVKIAAVTLVIALFDERMIEEGPRFSVLLLTAVIAVGLGPGTRDMLRATFGI